METDNPCPNWRESHTSQKYQSLSSFNFPPSITTDLDSDPFNYSDDYSPIQYKNSVLNTLSIIDSTEGPHIDLGGGSGTFIKSLINTTRSNHVEHIPGFNYQDYFVMLNPNRISKKQNPYQECFSSISSIPYANNTFYSLTGFHVFEYISPNSLQLSLSEIYRICKSDGVLYAIIPTIDSNLFENEFWKISLNKSNINLQLSYYWFEAFENVGFFMNDRLSTLFDPNQTGWSFVFTKSF